MIKTIGDIELSSPVNQKALEDLTGYKKAAKIAACLSKQGVRFLRGKHGQVFTTTSAINTALGIKKENNDDEIFDKIEIL